MYWLQSDVSFFYICYFIFVLVIISLGSKNASIFFNSFLFDGKMNLVGAFGGGHNLKLPKATRKTKTKSFFNSFFYVSIWTKLYYLIIIIIIIII